ncbi:Fic family protein [Anaerosalibacter sp. Marseille-P3206]|uniref:Fic family protein n=1 Tax=Anaerosalibacter sp. Marseille-P3206 TaxID=1871005 RepID=UPI000985A5A3|nr:Fic family protein [Anaerosalibacter sp. Marseille-P3206]
MQYMNKLFYNLGSITNREAKLKERLKYDSIVLPGLQIKPINQSKIYDLYYIPTMKTIDLISSISKDDIILMQLYDNLPKLAQRNFLIDMLSSELHSTNLLEGVRSSKEEIVFTAKEVLEPKEENKENFRFFNVIKSYRELQIGNLKRPKGIKDIRKIYDEITVDGVEEENLPDGKYFRSEATYVYTSGLKEIHRGITSASGTEEYIIFIMNKLLYFLNSDTKCNELVKNAIFHYYFGYIHPFYDGNGRTARFISSIYLKENYSWLTALSLSQGSNDNRSLYLKAFDSTNQVSMQGELNFFVDSFLEVLNNGQNILKENLQNKTILLEESFNKIENDSNIKEDRDLIDIMKVAIEMYLFGPHNDYIDVELLQKQENLNYTNQTIRKKLNRLYENKLLNKISKNPVRYTLNPDYLEF